MGGPGEGRERATAGAPRTPPAQARREAGGARGKGNERQTAEELPRLNPVLVRPPLAGLRRGDTYQSGFHPYPQSPTQPPLPRVTARAAGANSWRYDPVPR